MSNPAHHLTKEQSIGALSALNEKLVSKEVYGEVCIFGGAAMVLAFDAGESTRDVDGIFAPKSDITDAIAEVAEDLELRQDWLNDGVKGYLSSSADLTAEGMPQYSHLRGYDTAGDVEDAATLIRQLSLTKVDEVLTIVGRCYPVTEILLNTQYFVEDVIATLEDAS